MLLILIFTHEVGIQVFLGVLTLIWSVPVSLGVLHQMGAVIFLLGLVKKVK